MSENEKIEDEKIEDVEGHKRFACLRTRTMSRATSAPASSPTRTTWRDTESAGDLDEDDVEGHREASVPVGLRLRSMPRTGRPPPAGGSWPWARGQAGPWCLHLPCTGPCCRALREDVRAEFLGVARRRSFARNEVVCHAGDPADSLHLIISGRLSVRVSLASGDTAMINVLRPGDYFGELALLRPDGHRTATITALEPAETLVVTASAFHRLCQAQPAVERTLSTLLGHRIDELSQRLLEAMYVGLDRRLYRRLLELCDSYASGDGPVVVPLTQAQLADLTGGTRPTVNQALQRLVEQGIVELSRGKVVVLDVPRLRSKTGR